MVARKKTDVVQLSKIRMREGLRSKLARDAERNGTTLNGEIVDRLEKSYADEIQAVRDSAIIDILVRYNDVSSQLLRDIASYIAEHPEWNRNDADRKRFFRWLSVEISGKEPQEESASGDD